MNLYNLSISTGINDPVNAVCLRVDVRRCLDAHFFVFYPITRNAIAPIFFDLFEPDYVALLYGKQANIHDRVADEFFYALFAYAIISRFSAHIHWIVPEIMRSQEDEAIFSAMKRVHTQPTRGGSPSNDAKSLSGGPEVSHLGGESPDRDSASACCLYWNIAYMLMSCV